MGPKKEKKETLIESKSKDWSLSDPVNSNEWKCVVTLGVEKTDYDICAMKEFMKESVKGRRQEVSIIDYESTVLKIINDFAEGELPYKYKSLLHFSALFEEAGQYVKRKAKIPTSLLVQIVKVLLFVIKEETLTRITSFSSRNSDPIKIMAERPGHLGDSEKKKDVARKNGNGLKVRPPSITKQDTKLLKRGERAKDDQCIDDAPRNAYFDHYILLVGFYNHDFPMEMIKAGIPLHAVLCVDTSRCDVKWDRVTVLGKHFKRNAEAKAKEIQNFWTNFLKTIWDPTYCYYFRDTVFQMYVPRKLTCEKANLSKVLYKEISYLMYDLSDLKRQLNNYLGHLHLWKLGERGSKDTLSFMGPDSISNECITIPIMLQSIINSVCRNRLGEDNEGSIFSTAESTGVTSQETFRRDCSPSLRATHGSCFGTPDWELDLEERGEYNLLKVFYKTRELDVMYDLEKKVHMYESGKGTTEVLSTDTSCRYEAQDCGENMESALISANTILRMLWRKYANVNRNIYPLDYCLYAILMTKVVCSYQEKVDSAFYTSTSLSSSAKNRDFETIQNVFTEMRKPHFTVTEGSRSIIRSIPFNIKSTSRDFFCPEEFKVVSPEKLKASSAPQFRVTPNFKIQALYTSEIFSRKLTENPFESVKGFISECLFSKTNDFDCIEFLSKSKLLEQEKMCWSTYNCMDNTYCIFNDCILLMFHNRKDAHNFHHETFNQKLRTQVGLRDFYEYVQEDEAEWLGLQEELYQAKVFLSNKVLDSNSLRDLSDSDFWLSDSLKYTAMERSGPSARSGNEVKIAYSSLDRVGPIVESFDNFFLEEEDDLQGYDMSDMAVQYSGLKTIYYSDDSSVAVELIERLYGNQDLGVHVTLASHTLHLHSYVCPEPHVLDPFTFHVTYKNGIVVALGRRFVEVPDVEEEAANKTESETEIPTENTPEIKTKTVKDENFYYDLGASLPNGLCIRTVRKVVEPCYIKQFYVGKRATRSLEKSRLILPSGEVIVIMNDSTVQIFKPNSSIIDAKLVDLTEDPETGKLDFSHYEVTSQEGWKREIEDGMVSSSYRYHVFQNKDSGNTRTFYRRWDGTNYLLQNDGSVCVQFKDGTKIWSTVFLQENVEEHSHSTGSVRSDEFTFVHMKIIVEHPEFATVVYNTETMNWKILLPSDSIIRVHREGHYCIDIDKRTKLEVGPETISMRNHFQDGQVKCCFTADLTVFENKTDGVYCRLRDFDGKTFIVEGNSNCYVLNSHGCSEKVSEKESMRDDTTDVDLSEFVASTDLQISPINCKEPSNKLSRENKYFVVKRDFAGMELLHTEDLNKTLKKREKGSLLYTQKLPGSENRCFVLMFPVVSKKVKKWEMNTILPNPKYERNCPKETISSTYGIPPTWMHPFPKKKTKFSLPAAITCRVFIETKRTNVAAHVGTLDYYFCEMDEVTEIVHSQIPPNGVDEYLRKLANDNQDMLKEMYALAASSIINKNKKVKKDHTEELQRYLRIMNHKKLRDLSYKKCIGCQIIPNYFEHSDGMIWSILHELVLTLNLSPRSSVNVPQDKECHSDVSLLTFTSRSNTFSYEEIECPTWTEKSFSSLTCRSDFSAETAPPVLRTVGVKCKVRPVRNLSSAPLFTYREKFMIEDDDEGATNRPCDFQESDMELLEKEGSKKVDKPPFSLDDLMHLGFV